MYFYVYWKFTIFQLSFMQKFIKYFFKNFLVLIASYHIIITILGYGILGWNSQTYISLFRDWLWLLFVWIMVVFHSDKIREYLKKWKKVWIAFIILILFSVLVSFLQKVSMSNMMIWLKYGVWYLLIFLTASFVWFTWIKKFSEKDIWWIQYLLMFILFFWFFWQILKIFMPDFFMWMWYGKLDDFHYGSNPPIYYLTWYEGTMRWQWMFAGPNNYGYFLIAFLPLVMLFCGGRWQDLKNFIKSPRKNINFLMTILWILAIILTLSRSALLGMIFVIAMLSKNWIKKHKKLSIWILLVCIAWLVGLSLLKSESTLGHINAKFAYIWEIVNHPLWHGLWSSGPAVHHEWTMLPENYFMQIMLDMGTVWFIMWAVCIMYILLIIKNIEKLFEKWDFDAEQEAVFLAWKRLTLWWSALLIMWLFLHVFEDSMVNYLFFGLYWLLTWYLSQFCKENWKTKIIDIIKNNTILNN